jgi:hypothetical protein
LDAERYFTFVYFVQHEQSISRSVAPLTARRSWESYQITWNRHALLPLRDFNDKRAKVMSKVLRDANKRIGSCMDISLGIPAKTGVREKKQPHP